MRNQASKPQAEKLPDIRNRLLNRMMTITAFLAVPALAASIMRVADVGWRFSMTVQVFVFFALWGAVIFREALSYGARSFLLVGILLLLAVSSYLSFGIITGPLWSLVAVIFITLVFGRRAGIYAVVFVLALVAAMYLLYSKGMIQYDQDFNSYMTSKLSWINNFTTMLLVSSGILIIVSGLYSSLEQALYKAEAQIEDNRKISVELEIRAAEQSALVDEYKSALAKLTESDERFRLIAENTSDFVWMLDLDGNLVHAGSNSEKFTGYTAEEVSAIPLEARYDAVSAARARAGIAAIRERVANGLPVEDGTATVQCIKKNGDVVWHEVKYRLTKSASGEFYLIGISRDVTERVLTELETAEKAKLLNALDRVNRAISSTPDLNEMMSAVLNETLEIFGCQRSVLIYPCDPDAQTWAAMMEKSAPGYLQVSALGKELPTQPYLREIMVQLLESEGPRQFLSTDLNGEMKVFDEPLTIQSRLAIAIRPRSGKPWIFALHQCTHARIWTDNEKELMKQVASRLADGLSLAISYKERLSSEEKFKSLVSTMADWVWECDREGNFTFASERVKEILGFTPEEITSMSYTDLVMPGDIERVRKVVAEAARERRPIRNLENWNKTKDGKPVCLMTNGLPVFNEDGKLVGYRGVDIDITERKINEQALTSSERKFRELFQSASVGIVLANSRNQIVDANAEALRTLGYSLAEIKKMGCESLLDPSEQQSRPLLTIENAGGIEPIRQHRRFLRRNGSVVHVLVSVGSNLEGSFIVMFHDLTSQRKIEQQLFQAQKLEAVVALADGIALDFNNILHAIVGFSSLLKADASISGKALSYVDHIEQSAERGAELVKGMMAFSSSNSGDMEAVELSSELSRAVQFMSSTFPRNIEIKTHFGHGSALVEADPSQLEQAVMNLGTNARDAMPEGGLITISTSRVVVGRDGSVEWADAFPGDYVKITIADNGAGMPPDIAAHVFEPFFTTKEEGKGSGLGLSTVYGIVKNHRGYVHFESSPGDTQFSMLLPVLAEKPDGAEKLDEESLESAQAANSGGTVLVVDDEAYVREIAEEGLRAEGYKVLAVGSGEEALEIVCAGKVEISTVVLDLGMPGMSGEKCLELLLDAKPNLRVVVASGYGVSSVVEQLLASGAAAFLKKPYRVQALADVVAGRNDKKVIMPITMD